MKNNFYCPSCGYDLGFIPWDDGSPADEICSSCGIQFGYDDFAGGNEKERELIHDKWRKNWIDMDMPWKSSSEKPLKWDPDEQLKNMEILNHFCKRREIFYEYLEENNIQYFACQSCGFPTLSEQGGYEICNICGWEDDGQNDDSADEIFGGPNSDLSLTASRLKIGKILRNLEEKLDGNVNLDPKEVLSILADRNLKIDNGDFNLLIKIRK